MDTAAIPGLDLDREALDRARLSRDARFDGRFYIAVLSTRIYCRPICPSPSSKPHNVRYYATAAAAAEAGFRPCLRCRPEAAPDSPAWLGVSAVVRRGLRLIQEGALDDGSVHELSLRLGIGPRHLRRLFVAHVGASPVAVAQTRRLHFAKRLIDDTNLSMTEIALASGYGSIRRFNTAFRASYGRTPSELRQRRGAIELPGTGTVLRLAFHPPYDWNGILEFLRARAIHGVEHVDDTCYARTIVIGGEPAHVVIRSPNGSNAIEFEVHGAPASALFDLVNRVRRMFDLSVDPARIVSALGQDALLGPLVRRYPGLRIPGVWDSFECAVRAVLSQGSLAEDPTLLARLIGNCGTRLAAPLGPDASLTHLFPAADKLVTADLHDIGLADSQIVALRALAVAVIEKQIDFNAPSEELSHTLVQLPGIGHGTAQYVALRASGDPDAFATSDTAFDRQSRLSEVRPVARPLAERADVWRPWRGYAALYLWRADEEQLDGRAALRVGPSLVHLEASRNRRKDGTAEEVVTG